MKKYIKVLIISVGLFATQMSQGQGPTVAAGYSISELASGGLLAGQGLVGIVADPLLGDVYVAAVTTPNINAGSRYNGFNLYKITSAGAVALVGYYPFPSYELVQMRWGPDGKIYTLNNNIVMTIDPLTGGTATFSSGLPFSSSNRRYDLDFDPNGNLIVSAESIYTFFRVTPPSGYVLIGNSVGLVNSNHGDAFGIDPDGNYVVYPDCAAQNVYAMNASDPNRIDGQPLTVAWRCPTNVNTIMPNSCVYSNGVVDPESGDVFSTTFGSPGSGGYNNQDKIVHTTAGGGVTTLFVDNSSGITDLDIGGSCNSLFFLDNKLNAVFQVPLVNCVPPAINCPENIIVNNDPGQCSAVVDFEATDDVGDPVSTITYSHEPGSFLFPVGTTEVTATATNDAGTDTCTFNVTVNDAEPPVTICQNFSADLDANGEWEITAAYLTANAFISRTDNCGVASNVNATGPSTYTCDNLGENTITIFSFDTNGNQTQCTVTLTINDPLSACNQPPVAVCQPLIVDADSNCEATTVASDFDNGSTDPDGDQLTFIVSPEGPYPLGITEVTLTASDGALSSSCTTSITVEDNEDPVVTDVQDIIAVLDNTGNIVLKNNIDVAPAVTASDNCDIDWIRIRGGKNNRTFGCADILTNPNVRTIRVRDVNGNNTDVPVNVIVQDNRPQGNYDGDALGDLCDEDDDNDGILDVDDNCQFVFNPDQSNYDGDAEGDLCDSDDDNDGCPDTQDPHPFSMQGSTIIIGGCDTGVANQALGCSTMADILMDCCLNSNSQFSYIRCVNQTLSGWLRARIITRSEQRAISQCASRNYYNCSNSNVARSVSTTTTSGNAMIDFDVETWPNPSGNDFNLRVVTDNKLDKVDIQVMDITGKLIHSDQFERNQLYKFGESLQAGVYFVRISQASDTKTIRVIKQ